MLDAGCETTYTTGYAASFVRVKPKNLFRPVRVDTIHKFRQQIDIVPPV